MPTFRPLSAEDVAQLGARTRGRVDLTEYTEFLESMKPGDWGELSLSDSENRRAVKRRLTTSAKRMNKQLRYRRAEGQTLRFEVS
jgi:hypothetical protein